MAENCYVDISIRLRGDIPLYKFNQNTSVFLKSFLFEDTTSSPLTTQIHNVPMTFPLAKTHYIPVDKQ
jgi:hypothetical protein